MLRSKISRLVKYIFLVFWLVIAGYPFVFMLQSSFKERIEFFTNSVWALPENIIFTNYINALESGFATYFLNSLLICLSSVVLILITGSLASYAIARLDLKYNSLFYIVFLAGMMIPVHVTLIPIYKLTISLGMYDRLYGVVGPYVAFSLPITVFILTSFMRDIPHELEEAAIIDGAGKFQIFTRIIIPVSKPALSTVAIYNLIILWNEFVYALVILSSPEKWNLTVGLWNFKGQYGNNIPMIMAGLVLSILPIIILYVFFQKRVIRGMMAGALKQ
ncbi:MAG: carbohydrate ABC transporter permease [Halanaerobiales bacterium]